MLFPGSRIWYEGAVADLATLTEEIKASGFSGYIVLEFQDSLDIVICAAGEFLKVIEKIGRRILSTKKYREIWGKCRIKPGRMTVVELPPRLARRLRGLYGRHLLCSGTAATGCDPQKIISDLKREAFSGILDCVAPEGKLLLDFEAGVVVSCYYTEYEGLTREGLSAFRTWHQSFLRATHPCFFSCSQLGPGEQQQWDEILLDYVDQVRLPLRSSVERLERSFGRKAAAGEILFVAGARPIQAFLLLSGEIELIPSGPGADCGPVLNPDGLIGLSWLFGIAPAHATGRVRVPSRLLAFDREELETLIANSPVLSARCVREAAGLLLSLRSRLAAFHAEPRLLEMEAAVTEALQHHPLGAREGVPVAEIFSEITHVLPLSLPEIDVLFRRLAALGGVGQSGGRIALLPREL